MKQLFSLLGGSTTLLSVLAGLLIASLFYVWQLRADVSALTTRLTALEEKKAACVASLDTYTALAEQLAVQVQEASERADAINEKARKLVLVKRGERVDNSLSAIEARGKATAHEVGALWNE